MQKYQRIVFQPRRPRALSFLSLHISHRESLKAFWPLQYFTTNQHYFSMTLHTDEDTALTCDRTASWWQCEKTLVYVSSHLQQQAWQHSFSAIARQKKIPISLNSYRLEHRFARLNNSECFWIRSKLLITCFSSSTLSCNKDALVFVLVS